MFFRLGKAVQRWRWPILVVWVIALALAPPLAPRLTTILKSGGFSSANLEATRAVDALAEHLGFPRSSVVAVFHSDSLAADSPRFQTAVERTLASLRTIHSVTRILPPSLNPRQVASDGYTAYAVIALDVSAESAAAEVRALLDKLHDDDLTVSVSGAPVFYADIEDASERDLRRAEIVAFPLGLLALLIVQRSVVAAVIPVAVGGAGVATALATIFVLGQAVDLSIFVLNMATMLGLGLSIDYALFLTSRFREELERHSVGEAVAITVATAGRAVFFSALTVLTGLLGLVSFDSPMLRSLGIGGVVVVSLAALAALTLLPALLAILGPRVNAIRLPTMPAPRGFSWLRLATAVMRHPLAVALPVLGLLLALGWPFLAVRLSAPDATILPPGTPSREGYETLRAAFGQGEVAPITIFLRAQGSVLAPANLSAIYDLTHDLARDPRVARVESIVDLDPRLTKEQYQLLYDDPARVVDPYARESLAALVKDDATVVSVVGRYPLASDEAFQLVRTIRREVPHYGFTSLVGGGSAAILDYVADLYADFPRAIALVVITTYLALFALFRSVVLPLKAILMNTLSILASYGALVAVFQEGNLSHILGFTALGFVEASLPIVMFCFLFGVSMDYEVFLLTRVKEAYDRCGDNTRSVIEGLERSGPIITSAALIVVVVSASFVTADIVLIKALGLGTAVAVFLDATVVRALLVPATMRLLGKLNWWLPWRARNAPLPSSDPTLVLAAIRNEARGARRFFGSAAAPLSHARTYLILPALAIAVLTIGLASGRAGWTSFESSKPSAKIETLASPPPRQMPQPVAFPRDEAPHDNLAEWWYYTGHLDSGEGPSFGFELVAFQSIRGSSPVGYAAHFAISDFARQAFHFDQRATTVRQQGQQNGLALRLGDWQLGGEGGRDHLAATMPSYAMALDLETNKPPVLHGSGGIVSFGPAGDSYYYSRSRMSTTGTLTVDGSPRSVRGSAWMDHQWGDFVISPRGGWDWFGLQLSDGSDLMISLVRSGSDEMVYGTYVLPNGEARHLTADMLRVKRSGTWHSLRSDADYPAGWEIALPSAGMTIAVTPMLPDQELDTRASTGVIYWEGAVEIAGTQDGRAITGHGYVELTGYAR